MPVAGAARPHPTISCRAGKSHEFPKANTAPKAVLRPKSTVSIPAAFECVVAWMDDETPSCYDCVLKPYPTTG